MKSEPLPQVPLHFMLRSFFRNCLFSICAFQSCSESFHARTPNLCNPLGFHANNSPVTAFTAAPSSSAFSMSFMVHMLGDPCSAPARRRASAAGNFRSTSSRSSSALLSVTKRACAAAERPVLVPQLRQHLVQDIHTLTLKISDTFFLQTRGLLKQLLSQQLLVSRLMCRSHSRLGRTRRRTPSPCASQRPPQRLRLHLKAPLMPEPSPSVRCLKLGPRNPEWNEDATVVAKFGFVAEPTRAFSSCLGVPITSCGRRGQIWQGGNL